MDTQNIIYKNNLNQVSEIPADKIKAMKDMTEKLRKKYPKWKPERVGRKVAKHFGIELVDGKSKIYS